MKKIHCQRRIRRRNTDDGNEKKTVLVITLILQMITEVTCWWWWWWWWWTSQLVSSTATEWVPTDGEHFYSWALMSLNMQKCAAGESQLPARAIWSDQLRLVDGRLYCGRRNVSAQAALFLLLFKTSSGIGSKTWREDLQSEPPFGGCTELFSAPFRSFLFFYFKICLCAVLNRVTFSPSPLYLFANLFSKIRSSFFRRAVKVVLQVPILPKLLSRRSPLWWTEKKQKDQKRRFEISSNGKGERSLKMLSDGCPLATVLIIITFRESDALRTCSLEREEGVSS